MKIFLFCRGVVCVTGNVYLSLKLFFAEWKSTETKEGKTAVKENFNCD
jgi:hypothetical protein